VLIGTSASVAAGEGSAGKVAVGAAVGAGSVAEATAGSAGGLGVEVAAGPQAAARIITRLQLIIVTNRLSMISLLLLSGSNANALLK